MEVRLSKPGVQEAFILQTDGSKEYLTKTSNRYVIEKREFGTYSRKKTGLHRQALGIVRSQPKKKNATSETKSDGAHDWQIEVLGQRIDRTNKRYGQVIRMLRKQIQSKGWEPVDVHKIEISASAVKDTRTAGGKAKTQEVPFFDACKTTFEGRPICELREGFIFLD